MKQFILLFAIMLSMTVTSNAQTYLEHLQQKTPGLGSVTVKQNKAIDELVNGKVVPQDEKTKTNNTQNTPKPSDNNKKQTPDSVKKTEHHEVAIDKDKTSIPHESPVKKPDAEKEENTTPSVDMSKKVMRSSYKVTGYRVQAYAGGNSRNDRLKAEQIGNAIKMKFPDQPVYVHFYSPRWICRIGNFRSQTEAKKMLAKIRAMGYSQACLVKGKITVQN